MVVAAVGAVAASVFDYWRRAFLAERHWEEGLTFLFLGALGALCFLFALGAELTRKRSLRRVFVVMALAAFGGCLPKWTARAWYDRQVADARAWCEAWAQQLDAERARSGAVPAALPAEHELFARAPYLIRVYEERKQAYYVAAEGGGFAFHVGRGTFRGDAWHEWSL